jgi:hypothetical protein
LDRAFFDVFDLGTIVPAPSRQGSVGGALNLTIAGTGEAIIVMSVTPKKISRQDLRLRVGSNWHTLEITVLP